ncbi:MAG: DUF6591 domain-containing protein [Oscillospiraceae bacterium]
MSNKQKKTPGCLTVIVVLLALNGLNSIIHPRQRNIESENSLSRDNTSSVSREVPVNVPVTEAETLPEPTEENSEIPVTPEPPEMPETVSDEPVPVEEETQNDVSFADVKAAVENGDYSLVTPEFKETMDAYEAFYDEYVAFMKKYTSGEGDMMSMLGDYTNMLAKMEEWSAKIDAIDENTLSPADDAYYLLVTLRIEQKLLGAM